MKVDYQIIQKLIANNPHIAEFGKFGEGVSDKWIEKAQTRLKIKFPPSYVWWLKNYSGVEINGEEVFSIYEKDFDSVVGGDIVYMNELNRRNKLFLDSWLVVQTNNQAETYYFDLNEVDTTGEYPVYVNFNVNNWRYADNFLHFLAKKIQE